MSCPPTNNAISRARLQINTRMWIAGTAKELFAPVLKPDRAETEVVTEPADFLRAWRVKHSPAEVN
jgi:hypothetical protein